MCPSDDRLDPYLENELAALREVLPRDSQAATRGRARFLAEAAALPQPVSEMGKQRRNGWSETITSIFRFRKEPKTMFAQIISIVMLLSALLGGTGAATVYASQASLPGDFLYPVKTWSEDARAGLTADPQAQLDLSLEFAERRVNELTALAKAGLVPPEEVMSRLQLELDQAVQLALALQQSQDEPVMEQLRQEMQQQERAMLNAQAQNPAAEALMTRTRQMVQERLRLVDSLLEESQRLQDRDRTQDQTQDRLQDQDQDRDQLRDQDRLQIHQTGTAGPGQAAGDSGNSYGPGPATSLTPTLGSGYGPGPKGTPVPGGSESNGGGAGQGGKN